MTPEELKNKFTPMRMGALIIGAIALIALLVLIPRLVEDLPANNVMVIQSVGGDLNCYTEPGPKWQGMGTVTLYPRWRKYEFDKHVLSPDGKAIVEDTGKQLQFNEGGTATLYGTVNWEMPLDCKSIIAIHRTFNSTAAIESNGVARMVNTAIQLSGSTMTSLESFAERKGELIEIINDQAQNGAYQMTMRQVEQTNPVTGEKKQLRVAEVMRGKDGRPLRQQASILDQFNIHLQPMSIEKLAYSEVVQKQIQQNQDATTQVKVSEAQALKAVQAAITAEKEGQANAATEKWKQETIKARVVTEAQQKLEVAQLGAKEAEAYKREQVLRGEGDSERRRLVMSADGALDTKLKAWVDVQSIWAAAFKDYKGAMVPQIVMGQDKGGTAVSGASQLVDMLTAKTARDLQLDLSNVATPKK